MLLSCRDLCVCVCARASCCYSFLPQWCTLHPNTHTYSLYIRHQNRTIAHSLSHSHIGHNSHMFIIYHAFRLQWPVYSIVMYFASFEGTNISVSMSTIFMHKGIQYMELKELPKKQPTRCNHIECRVSLVVFDRPAGCKCTYRIILHSVALTVSICSSIVWRHMHPFYILLESNKSMEWNKIFSSNKQQLWRNDKRQSF